ncbi:MAG: aldehyde dehydrogenase, partial [Gemmatimonadales bacterium]
LLSRVPASPPIDRTSKLYIRGAQVRPDSGYSLSVHDASGVVAGEVGHGNRKDIRNAVEAAHAARGWGRATAHLRAQVLFFVAENLAARRDEFVERIVSLTGRSKRQAREELDLSLSRLFSYAAWADKWDGRVHHTPIRNVTLAMPEPLGVMAVVCPEEWPLLGFLSATLPPLAMGNAVVAVPSERWPLLATDLYQVLDTSDLPGGALNIVTGPREELAAVLAAHDDVDAMWYWGSAAGSAEVERLSAGNLKQTWVHHGSEIRWDVSAQGEGERFLRHATQIKNVWVPYGE